MERVEIERKFKLTKRKCGMGLATAKQEMLAAHVVTMFVLMLNLCNVLCAILQLQHWLLRFREPRKKYVVI